MASKKYKCTNFADCDVALSKEEIEIDELGDLVCPGCKKNTLEPLGAPASPPALKWAIIGGVALVVAGVAAYLFWPSSPDPGVANTLIEDFFPRLK